MTLTVTHESESDYTDESMKSETKTKTKARTKTLSLPNVWYVACIYYMVHVVPTYNWSGTVMNHTSDMCNDVTLLYDVKIY